MGQEWGHGCAGLSASGSHKAAIKASAEVSLGKDTRLGDCWQNSAPHGMLDRGPLSCWMLARGYPQLVNIGPSQDGPCFLKANKREGLQARRVTILHNIITSHHLASAHWWEASHRPWPLSREEVAQRHEKQKWGAMGVPLDLSATCFISWLLNIAFRIILPHKEGRI